MNYVHCNMRSVFDKFVSSKHFHVPALSEYGHSIKSAMFGYLLAHPLVKVGNLVVRKQIYKQINKTTQKNPDFI